MTFQRCSNTRQIWNCDNQEKWKSVRFSRLGAFPTYLLHLNPVVASLAHSKDMEVRLLNSPFSKYICTAYCKNHFEESEGANEHHHVDILQWYNRRTRETLVSGQRGSHIVRVVESYHELREDTQSHETWKFGLTSRRTFLVSPTLSQTWIVFPIPWNYFPSIIMPVILSADSSWTTTDFVAIGWDQSFQWMTYHCYEFIIRYFITFETENLDIIGKFKKNDKFSSKSHFLGSSLWTWCFSGIIGHISFALWFRKFSWPV